MAVNRMEKPDSLIRKEGMDILLAGLGKVDAERFISLVIREPFDYTEWQKNLFEGMSLDEICEKGMDCYNRTSKSKD